MIKTKQYCECQAQTVKPENSEKCGKTSRVSCLQNTVTDWTILPKTGLQGNWWGSWKTKFGRWEVPCEAHSTRLGLGKSRQDAFGNQWSPLLPASFSVGLWGDFSFKTWAKWKWCFHQSGVGGGSLVLGIQCQLLYAVCVGALRTSLGKSALPFLPPRWNSLLQIVMSFPLFQTFLQWYLPRLTSFMFIRNSTSFHPAPQVCFILYTALPHIYIPHSASLAELKVLSSSLQRLTL